jgi:8-oxo-dGTP diphosphatase
MEDPSDIDLRCSVAAFRGDSVLLVHRKRDDAKDWVLPGGTPRPGESMASCARRETLEEIRPAGGAREDRVRPRGAGAR